MKGALLSAILIALAFPPLELTPLIWIALVPWLLELRRATTWRQALARGFWLTIFYALFVEFWVAFVLREFGRMPWPAAIVGLVFYAPFSQFFHALFALAHHFARRFLALRQGRVLHAVILSLLFAFLDRAIPKLFTIGIGHSLYGATYLRQVAELGGVGAVVFLIAITNFAMLEIWLWIRARGGSDRGTFPRATVAAAAIAFALSWTYGWVRVGQIRQEMENPAGVLHAVSIQGNIPNVIRMSVELGLEDGLDRILETYLKLTDRALAEGPRPDLIVWPEAAYPSRFRNPQTPSQRSRDQRLEAAVRRWGLPLVFGAFDSDGTRQFNSLFLLDPQTGAHRVHHKSRVMFFGEYIPGMDQYPWIQNLFPHIKNIGRGEGPEVFPLVLRGRNFQFSPVVCYEICFPDFSLEARRKGAQLMINLTNDSWFGPFSEPYLHLAISVFRSIENRTPQIRSTNTGFTALILPDGSIAPRSGLGTEEIIRMKIPIGYDRRLSR